MDSRPDAVAECDLLLTGGRVIDPETGLDKVVDVAVSDGRIVAVGGPAPRARTTFDVGGRVVTAGFIDLHSHAQNIPSLRLQALDGVTTALELESGAGDVQRSLERAAEAGRPVNYGYSASWAQARMDVMDGSSPEGGFLDFTNGIAGTGWQRPADASELARIIGRLEEQLSAGAVGIGVLVGYAPQTGRNEYLRVASLAARHGVPTYTHARFKNPEDPESALEGAAEVVAAAAGSGAHMHLCHVNSTSLRAIDEVAELIDGARRRGLEVTTEAYPYGAGMTAVGVPFLHPDNLARLGIQPSNLSIVATGERPKDAARLVQIRRETPGALVIIHYLDEDQEQDLSLIHRALLMADTAVASDAIPFTTPTGTVVEGDRELPPDASSHPRTTGTFSRFLRTMVRETGALPLMEALRRCSLLPAQILQEACPAMARKGRVQIGADADLVVFNAELVSDRSTYDAPQASSTGFDHVLVAGQPVVRDGSITTALPGRPVVRGAR
ncbi:N-acyl-D-aspartate/D-glutamate deacylase [Kribbella steppae]|uniref:N-acyl-D-aspartate/D-glutamate deacylase n=1 Tax=Kribbella steppae TaxID=2512223 RepID=A0A4R2H343_9ACTN|nr:amidohydrolase family protein [Kribbella steppae]TCO19698.1 N-acyl-D-aspartate/D-glutamate deacylase [Kribbella steppae]